MLPKLLKRLKPDKSTHYQSSQQQPIPAADLTTSEGPQSKKNKKIERGSLAPTPEQPELRERISTEQTTSYHEQTQQILQSKLDEGKNVKLIPQEYAGPLFIRTPLVLDGQGATLWAFKGPVLSIYSSQVRLKNINIEVTGEQLTETRDECAIYVDKKVTKIQFENVLVRGQIIGLEGENGKWQYPHSLHLGELASNTVHSFRLQIFVPTKCLLESAISGIQLKPTQLEPGIQEIHLQVDALPDDVSLHGSLYLKTTHLKRCIYLTAQVIHHKNIENQAIIPILWSVDEEQSLVQKTINKKETLKPLLPAANHSHLTNESRSLETQKKSHSQRSSSPKMETHLARLKNSVFYNSSHPVTLNYQDSPPKKEKEQEKQEDKNDNIFFKQNRTS